MILTCDVCNLANEVKVLKKDLKLFVGLDARNFVYRCPDHTRMIVCGIYPYKYLTERNKNAQITKSSQ
jgi:hypothetical protein